MTCGARPLPSQVQAHSASADELQKAPGGKSARGFFFLRFEHDTMNVHSLASQSDPRGSEPLNVGLTFQYDTHSLADLVLKTRAIRALEGVATRYPIYRDIRCAARRKLEDVFDDLALNF